MRRRNKKTSRPAVQSPGSPSGNRRQERAVNLAASPVVTTPTNVIHGQNQASDPTFREKPVKSAMSRHALATLIQKEAKDIGELADMMETDYQVKYALAIINSNIAAVQSEVKAPGNDPRAKLLADQMQKLWEIHRPEMLEMLGKGRSAFEKVWDYNKEANLHFVRKLEHLPFGQTEMILEPNTGRFLGIAMKYKEKGKAGEPQTMQQASGVGGTYEVVSSSNQIQILEIPQPNSWWLALNPTATEPHGQSIHNGAPYKVYQERQQAIRLRMLFVQKLVIRGGVAHVPDQITLENGQSLDTFAETARAWDDQLAGGLAIFSNKKDADGDYEFNVTESPSIMDPAPLDEHIDGLDADQLQAYTIPPKTVLEGDAVGSFAMVSIQRLILDALIEKILNQMERSFQKYVIDKVAEANGLGGLIKISHEPLLDQSNQIMAQLVESILTSPQLPQIMTSGIVDVMELLKSSRIPLLPGAEEAIKKLFQQMAVQQQSAEQAAQAAAAAASGQPGPAATHSPNVSGGVAATKPATGGVPGAAAPAVPAIPAVPRPAAVKLANTANTPPISQQGRFIASPMNPLHRRMRTRYTAHPADQQGVDSAIGNVLRDLRAHAEAHGLQHKVMDVDGMCSFGPFRGSDPSIGDAATGAKYLRITQKGTDHIVGAPAIHIRIGQRPLGAMDHTRSSLPRDTIDIPVSGRPIGEIHGKVGAVKGLMEELWRNGDGTDQGSARAVSAHPGFVA